MQDLELIRDLRKLYNYREDRHGILIETDLSAIIPTGVPLAYSINKNKQVTGFKAGNFRTNRIEVLLKIISQFEHLERLVLYSNVNYELPTEICLLKKLNYLVLDGVVKIPQELFDKGLPVRKFAGVPIHYSRNKKKIIAGVRKFTELNPEVQTPNDVENLILEEIDYRDRHENISLDTLKELQLFAALTNEARDSILSDHGIYLVDPQRINDPPFEIIDQGLDVIRQYFKEKHRQGINRLFEAKIVIVGAGESGKTTLIKKLQNPSHPVPNGEDKRTEGIRVTTYPFVGETKFGIKEIQAHIWDFGGQELYHTTHQLFLTPDTLYILLNDNRKNDTDFYYWLNIVTLRAGENSPILMIFNAKNNSPRQIIPGEEIFLAFPNLIKESIDVNFADQNLSSIHQTKQSIESYFTGLEVLGKPFPAYWVKVRDELAKIEDEHITWSQFSQMCERNGVNDSTQIQILATTLHNLGVILYFPEVFGLDNLIILKSQWCIDAIYSALDIKDIDKNGGRFNEQILGEKWSDRRFAGNHLQLLKLMEHFDLCYKIEGTCDYIAPQLLPIEERRLPNTFNWDIAFQFSYLFMPAGLITRLIARMSIYIKSPYVWRAGVTLEWEDGTLAEVIEHQLTHRIVIKIKGPEKKRRLLDIRKCLYDLQKDFKGLKFEEAISCNCSDCVAGGDITIFNIKDLEDDAQHNDTVTCRNGSRKKIPARNILEGISYKDEPRIFISYSHQNEDLKNEFRKMISPLEREGKWSVWDDRWLLPGDNWNKEIIKHLNEANIIVLMLTPDFFSSNFIYDIELTRAIQRHETGQALLIGIVVSDCLWEDTPLSKIQLLPKDGTPVERHTHRNEVWKSVANKIKETIADWQGKANRIGGWI